jgi:hypothetical protein
MKSVNSWSSAEVEHFLGGRGAPVRTSPLVELVLVLLQASYEAMVVLAGYLTWR